MKAGDLTHYAGYIEAEIKEILGQGTVAQFLQASEKEPDTGDPQKQEHIEIPITPEEVEIQLKVQSSQGQEDGSDR